MSSCLSLRKVTWGPVQVVRGFDDLFMELNFVLWTPGGSLKILEAGSGSGKKLFLGRPLSLKTWRPVKKTAQWSRHEAPKQCLQDGQG